MKRETQKTLGEEVQHDLKKYASNIHHIVLETEKKYNLSFKYGKVEGQIIDSDQVKTT
jgi:hypothetical protein